MAVEIERKFLVKKDVWKDIYKPKPSHLKQAYILEEDQKVVRIRIKGKNAFLTIKNKGRGISRLEFEYQIPIHDAVSLIQTMGGPTIEKERVEILFAGKCWEVDVFSGSNQGLILAEIELTSEDERFQKPEWIGQEVSQDARYFNVNLQKYPFSEWKDK